MQQLRTLLSVSGAPEDPDDDARRIAPPPWRGVDDLSLSDEDDWGMSAALSSTRRSLRDVGRSAFWDRAAEGDSAADGGDDDGMELAAAGGDGAFEIGDDDYYASERRGTSPGTAAADDDGADDASSHKEEVVNAYRDYLKSIRDGGFESYLDADDAAAAARDADAGGADGAADADALERALDVEEERASRGALYGDVYGVRDVRTSRALSWRTKAQALLRQEEERERRDAASPSRRVLARFRRKRSDAAEAGEDRAGSEWRRHRLAVLRGPRARGACAAVCLVAALAAGLSWHGGDDGAEAGVAAGPAVPPSDRNGTAASVPHDHGPVGAHAHHPGASDAIANALDTFDPVWDNRRSGWEGITFAEAVDFCYTRGNRVPCPYEIYCNQGTEGAPYQGTRPNGEQWAAVSNGANQWVQVGELFECHRYTDLHDQQKPDWGLTGVSVEHDHGAGGITQNILCCVDVYHIGTLDPFTDWGKQEDIDTTKADSTEETTKTAWVKVEDAESERDAAGGNAAAPSPHLVAQQREKEVIAAFQPVWFSAAHGWSGGSYEEGVLFCESYHRMVLCPWEAYCPHGPARPPLPGSMALNLDGAEEWAPANGPLNTWIQIGTLDGDEGTRCTLHHATLGERPQWGIDGDRTEVKHHILCCRM